MSRPPAAEPTAIPWDIDGQMVKMCTQDDWTPAMDAAARRLMHHGYDYTALNLHVDYANDPDWPLIFWYRDERSRLVINYAKTKDIIESGDLGELVKLLPKELRLHEHQDRETLIRKAKYWDRMMCSWDSEGTEEEFGDEFIERVVELINDFQEGK